MRWSSSIEDFGIHAFPMLGSCHIEDFGIPASTGVGSNGGCGRGS